MTSVESIADAHFCRRTIRPSAISSDTLQHGRIVSGGWKIENASLLMSSSGYGVELRNNSIKCLKNIWSNDLSGRGQKNLTAHIFKIQVGGVLPIIICILRSLESAGFDPEDLHRRLHGETWPSFVSMLSELRRSAIAFSSSRVAKESCFSPTELQKPKPEQLVGWQEVGVDNMRDIGCQSSLVCARFSEDFSGQACHQIHVCASICKDTWAEHGGAKLQIGFGIGWLYVRPLASAKVGTHWHVRGGDRQVWWVLHAIQFKEIDARRLHATEWCSTWPLMLIGVAWLVGLKIFEVNWNCRNPLSCNLACNGLEVFVLSRGIVHSCSINPVLGRPRWPDRDICMKDGRPMLSAGWQDDKPMHWPKMSSAVLSHFCCSGVAYTFGLWLPCPFCSDHNMSRSPIFDTTHTRRLLAGEEFSDEELKWPGGPESLVTDGECQSFRRATVHCDILRHAGDFD